MDKKLGRLESELERAGKARAADETVVAIAGSRGKGTVAEGDRRFRELLGALPAAVFTTDAEGRLVGVVNMQIDISERKRAEQRQHLMVRELHHRVKNTLATVQAIMGSTARTATNMEDFQNALIGRIGALSKTHILLSDDSRPV